jgi:hypothetical protein
LQRQHPIDEMNGSKKTGKSVQWRSTKRVGARRVHAIDASVSKKRRRSNNWSQRCRHCMSYAHSHSFAYSVDYNDCCMNLVLAHLMKPVDGTFLTLSLTLTPFSHPVDSKVLWVSPYSTSSTMCHAHTYKETTHCAKLSVTWKICMLFLSLCLLCFSGCPCC